MKVEFLSGNNFSKFLNLKQDNITKEDVEGDVFLEYNILTSYLPLYLPLYYHIFWNIIFSTFYLYLINNLLYLPVLYLPFFVLTVTVYQII